MNLFLQSLTFILLMKCFIDTTDVETYVDTVRMLDLFSKEMIYKKLPPPYTQTLFVELIRFTPGQPDGAPNGVPPPASGPSHASTPHPAVPSPTPAHPNGASHPPPRQYHPPPPAAGLPAHYEARANGMHHPMAPPHWPKWAGMHAPPQPHPASVPPGSMSTGTPTHSAYPHAQAQAHAQAHAHAMSQHPHAHAQQHSPVHAQMHPQQHPHAHAHPAHSASASRAPVSTASNPSPTLAGPPIMPQMSPPTGSRAPPVQTPPHGSSMSQARPPSSGSSTGRAPMQTPPQNLQKRKYAEDDGRERERVEREREQAMLMKSPTALSQLERPQKRQAIVRSPEISSRGPPPPSGSQTAIPPMNTRPMQSLSPSLAMIMSPESREPRPSPRQSSSYSVPVSGPPSHSPTHTTSHRPPSSHRRSPSPQPETTPRRVKVYGGELAAPPPPGPPLPLTQPQIPPTPQRKEAPRGKDGWPEPGPPPPPVYGPPPP